MLIVNQVGFFAENLLNDFLRATAEFLHHAGVLVDGMHHRFNGVHVHINAGLHPHRIKRCGQAGEAALVVAHQSVSGAELILADAAPILLADTTIFVDEVEAVIFINRPLFFHAQLLTYSLLETMYTRMKKQPESHSSKKEIIETSVNAGAGALALIEPISGTVLSVISGAVRNASNVQAKCFLNKLEKALRESKSSLQELMTDLQSKDSYAEMLMDYVRSAIHSPSKTAITALSLIYYEYYQKKHANRLLFQISYGSPESSYRC